MLSKCFNGIESQSDRIAIAQLIATIFVATSSLMMGWVAAYSSLLGGLVSVLPGIAFIRIASARTVFRHIGFIKLVFVKRAFRRLVYGKTSAENVGLGIVGQGTGSQEKALGADKVLRQIVRGELVKFILSIVLFIGVFTLVKPLNALFFFATFIGMQLLYAVVPLFEARTEAERLVAANHRSASEN